MKFLLEKIWWLECHNFSLKWRMGCQNMFAHFSLILGSQNCQPGAVMLPHPPKHITLFPKKNEFMINMKLQFLSYVVHIYQTKRPTKDYGWNFTYFAISKGSFIVLQKSLIYDNGGNSSGASSTKSDERSNIFIWKFSIFLPEYNTKRIKSISFSVSEKLVF